MSTFHDNLFGVLVYKKHFWRGHTVIRMFGLEKEILLTVDGQEDAEFSKTQKEAFSYFLSDMDSIMAHVEKEIHHYYINTVVESREIYGEAGEDQSPLFHSIKDLTKIVNPTELIVRRVREHGKRGLGLLCEAKWDIENGVGVKIENEVVKEVGYQDIVL